MTISGFASEMEQHTVSIRLHLHLQLVISFVNKKPFIIFKEIFIENISVKRAIRLSWDFKLFIQISKSLWESVQAKVWQ